MNTHTIAPSDFCLYRMPDMFLNAVMAYSNAKIGSAAPAGIPGDTGPRSHEELLTAVAENKDRQAFISLFEHFAPRIKSFLMKSGAPEDQADELAQEAMLTVWQRAPLYNPEKAAASTWIFTIARNKRIDALRKDNRPEPDRNDPLFVGGGNDLPSDHFEKAEDARRIAKALDTLPPDQADVIRKAYFEDKTHHKIAEEENLPLGTVKSRIRLALERLRSELGGKLA